MSFLNWLLTHIGVPLLPPIAGVIIRATASCPGLGVSDVAWSIVVMAALMIVPTSFEEGFAKGNKMLASTIAGVFIIVLVLSTILVGSSLRSEVRTFKVGRETMDSVVQQYDKIPGGQETAPLKITVEYEIAVVESWRETVKMGSSLLVYVLLLWATALIAVLAFRIARELSH